MVIIIKNLHQWRLIYGAQVGKEINKLRERQLASLIDDFLFYNYNIKGDIIVK